MLQITTIPDDLQALSRCLKNVPTVDFVISTGGLGPTPDDHTRQAIARWLQCPLDSSTELTAHVQRYLSARKRPFTEHHQQMTMLPMPVDCNVQVLPNEIGSACGIMLERYSTRWFFLPGVPGEMKHMMQQTVASHLPPSNLNLIQYGTVGLHESKLLEHIPEPWRDSSSICAKRTGTTLSFRLNSESAQSFPALELLNKLGVTCYSFTTEHHQLHADIAWVLLQELTQARHSIAFAESCTAGRISSWVASHPGASSVLRQSVVVYSNEAKTQYCNVPRELIVKHGAVSEPVARQLALGIRAAAKSEWGVGVTGIAGPGGGSKEKPVGTVHIAVSGPNGQMLHQHFQFSGARLQVINSSAARALMMVLNLLRSAI